jgi:hypothetical protein
MAISFRRSALALAVLGICAGVAIASQSKTEAVPPGEFFKIWAVLVAGPNGGTLCAAGGYDEDVNLCFRVEATGEVRVNGASVGAVNPMDPVWINAMCVKTGNGSWEMAFEISQHGKAVHMDSGVPIGSDQASTVTAEGAMIGALVVE